MTEKEYKFHKEICKLHALVEVKSQRMPKEQAFEEAKRQICEGVKLLSVQFLEDSKRAAQILYDRFEWFRQETSDIVLQMQGTK